MMKDTNIWNTEIVNHCYDIEAAKKICSKNTPYMNTEDIPYWPFSKDGNLTVKKCYHYLKDKEEKETIKKKDNSASTSYSSVPKSLWNNIWNLKVPPKIRNFIWRVCKNAIATEENKYNRKCANSNICRVCFKEVENTEHLLFKCEASRDTWFASQYSFLANIDSKERAHDWFNRLFTMDNNSKNKDNNISENIAWIAWSIWKARNDYIFNNVKIVPARNAINDFSAYNEYNMSLITDMDGNNLDTKTGNTKKKNVVLEYNNTDGIEIFCDAAYRNETGEAAAACYAKSNEELIIKGNAWKFEATSSAEAEAIGIRNATIMAKTFNGRQVTIYNDCSSMIKPLQQKRMHEDRRLKTIAKDILNICCNSNIRFQLVSRFKNRIADWVAKHKLDSTLFGNGVLGVSSFDYG